MTSNLVASVTAHPLRARTTLQPGTRTHKGPAHQHGRDLKEAGDPVDISTEGDPEGGGDAMTTSVDLTWLAMERVRYESLFDSETELPRWGLFLDRTAVALERAEHTGSGIAVFVLDEPHIPNESAHLRQVVERLRSRLSPGDTLARIGDDRFAAMCCDVGSDADAAMLARHLIYDSGLTCGLGIALSTPGDVPETLIGRALIASAPHEPDPIVAS
jgi:GGDEF domain-containing protein